MKWSTPKALKDFKKSSNMAKILQKRGKILALKFTQPISLVDSGYHPEPKFQITRTITISIYESLPRLRQKMVLWNVFGSKERKFHALSSKTFILNAHTHTRYLPTLIHIDIYTYILYMDGVKNWQKISFDCGRFSDPEKSKSITAALLFMLLLCMRGKHL